MKEEKICIGDTYLYNTSEVKVTGVMPGKVNCTSPELGNIGVHPNLLNPIPINPSDNAAFHNIGFTERNSGYASPVRGGLIILEGNTLPVVVKVVSPHNQLLMYTTISYRHELKHIINRFRF